MEQFVIGMCTRILSESVRNLLLLGPVVAKLLEMLDRERKEPENRIAMAGGYIALVYPYSLRGNEGF